MEHLVGALVRIMLVVIRHIMVGMKIFAPKLIYLKSAFVYIEVNVALFKAGGTSLPNFSLGVQLLNCAPCAVTDPLAMCFGRNEEKL